MVNRSTIFEYQWESIGIQNTGPNAEDVKTIYVLKNENLGFHI